MRGDRYSLLLAVVLAAVGVAGACGGSGTDVANPPGVGGNGSGATAGSSGTGGAIVDVSNDGLTSLKLTPENPTVTVKSGQALPTVQFQVDGPNGQVSAQWLIDRAEIGSIDQNGLFTAAGKAGGQATVEATVGTEKLSTTVTVNIETEQNGGIESDGGTTGGGVGGVGGEGEGGAIDAALRALLEGPLTADAELAFLYPYDSTVWPLGLLSPLLQWKAGPSAVADGVYIHLKGKYYDYKGFFGRPKPLPAGAPFVRHPIPQDVWDAATLSAAGDTLTATVVVAAGGVAYGPINESWTIAAGRLKGTVYYQSYGTKLAKNYSGAIGGDGMFGGATLAIKPGATDPVLVAGKTGGHADCRVCHSVSADGSRMVVQHGDNYQRSSSYDLNGGYAEAPYPASTDTQLGWVGLYPDGSIGVGNAVPLPGNANGASSGLYDMQTGAALATNLASFVTRAGFPAFSPNGKKLAFNFYAGPGDATVGAGDGKKLVVMDFDKATGNVSGAMKVYEASNPPGWPTFLPTVDGLVFQVELPSSSNEYFATRYGAKGELWWSDLATGTAHSLDQANGKGYLPTGSANHGDDSVLGYEPTVSPIASGGYAWVVFTSRRLYGNVATIDPWWSDPRDHDLTQTPTTKKLWVAAIDLNAKPGTDPSHPAFYLPGQELLAGNARGFWVVDPCKNDGSDCETGDECCSGFCQADPQTQKLSCGKKENQCSQEYDKCTTDADCCDKSLKCINERCSLVIPR
ncbi:MAG: hypothetical protein KC776_35970 [Myxococcales bacterium]|nr:hypothetical protein [Myxococcales bacterium]MCB9578530.1 hypothetical protein [Polyangiaceae bacterium]